MTSWTWHNINVDLPKDWEMLQFSNDPEQGRIAFADRLDFRFELSWRKTQGKPDLKRMRKEYASHLKHELEHDSVKDLRGGDWIGLLSDKDDQIASRFLRYDSETKTLLEVVFRWIEKRDKALEGQTLGSISVLDPNVSKTQRWRCFGLDLSIPNTLSLSNIQAMPASDEMEFGIPKQKDPLLKVERRGLTDFWLKSSLKDWLDRQLLRKPKTIDSQEYSKAGHDFARISGILPYGKSISSLIRRQEFDYVAWICPNDKRFYSINRSTRPSQSKVLKKGSVQLSCCPGNTVTL